MSSERDSEDFLASGYSEETSSLLPLSPESLSSLQDSSSNALMEAMDNIIKSSRRALLPQNEVTSRKRRRKSQRTGSGAKSRKIVEEEFVSAQIGMDTETHGYVIKETPMYVQCDNCDKWRKMHSVEENFQLPKVWFCWQNTDTHHNTCSTEEEELPPDSEYCRSQYQPGSIVWARVSGYPSWPAMIEDDPECLEFYESENDQKGEIVFTKYHVTFFDDVVSMAWIPVRNIKRFLKTSNPPRLNAKYRKRFGRRFNDAIDVANGAMDMVLAERLLTYSFARRHKGTWGLIPKSIVGLNLVSPSTLNETKSLIDIIDSLPDASQASTDDVDDKKNDASKKGPTVKSTVSKGKKRKRMPKDDYGGEIFVKTDAGAYGGQNAVEEPERQTEVLSNDRDNEERKDSEAEKVKNTMKQKKGNVESEVAKMEKTVQKEDNLKTDDKDSERSRMDKGGKKMPENDIGTIDLSHEKFQDESGDIFEETDVEVYSDGQEKLDKQKAETVIAINDLNMEKEESAGAGKVTVTMELKKDNTVNNVAEMEKTVKKNKKIEIVVKKDLAKKNKKIENVVKKDLAFKPSLEKVETEVWQAKEAQKGGKAKEETDVLNSDVKTDNVEKAMELKDNIVNSLAEMEKTIVNAVKKDLAFKPSLEKVETEVWQAKEAQNEARKAKEDTDVLNSDIKTDKVEKAMEWKKYNTVKNVAKMEKTVKKTKKIENVVKKDLAFKPSLEKVETEFWQAKEAQKEARKAKEDTDVLNSDVKTDKVENAMEWKKDNTVKNIAKMQKPVKKTKKLENVVKKDLAFKPSLEKVETEFWQAKEARKEACKAKEDTDILNSDVKTDKVEKAMKSKKDNTVKNVVKMEKTVKKTKKLENVVKKDFSFNWQAKEAQKAGKAKEDTDVLNSDVKTDKVEKAMEWKKDNTVKNVPKMEKTVKKTKKIENVIKKDLAFKPSLEKIETEVWQTKEAQKKAKRAVEPKEETDMNSDMKTDEVERVIKKDVENKVTKLEEDAKKGGKQKIKFNLGEKQIVTLDAKVHKEIGLEKKKKMNDKDHSRFTTKNFKTVICSTSPLKVGEKNIGGTKEKVVPEFPRRNKLFKPPVIKIDDDAPLNESEKKSPIAPQPSEVSTEPSAINSGLGLCYPGNDDIMSWDAVMKIPVGDGIVQKPSDETIVNQEPPFDVDEDAGFHFGDAEDVLFYGERKKLLHVIEDICKDPDNQDLTDFDANPMIEMGENSDPFDYD